MKKNEKNVTNPDDINPYELDKASKIPSWLIILFLKFWAAAAAVFFIVIGGLDIGLDYELQAEVDVYQTMAVNLATILLIGLGLTLFMHLIVRSCVRLMYNRRNNTYRFNMINLTGTKSLFVDLAYNMFMSFVLFILTIILGKYQLVLNLFGSTGGRGIDPITYGLCYIVIDAIFLLIKNLIIQIHERRKYYRLIQEE